MSISAKWLCISIVCFIITNVAASTPGPPGVPIAFRNGFVDIAALTTVIGSSVAESLVLGDRGFGGLAWAAISAFGAIFVIKACITGACPSWLRETLGVRNAASDGALGMDLRLEKNRRFDEKIRRQLDVAIGVTCRKETRRTFTSSKISTESVTFCRDIHAFDRSTMNLVHTIPASKPGDPLLVHTFAAYDFLFDGSDPYTNEQDWIAISSSLLKLVELHILWREGAPDLCLVAGVAWFYFFTAAIILWLRKKWGRWISDSSNEEQGVDIIVGHLPSAKRAGGERKIILGAGDNSILSFLQRIIWAVGGLVCMAWIIATYILLGYYDSKVTFIWIGFQFVWLLLRLLFHHFTEVKYPISHRIVPTPTTWVNMDSSMKERAMDLTMGLARYQTYIHPRGVYSYGEDIFTTPLLRSIFSQVQYCLQSEFALRQCSIAEDNVNVTVVAVVGDHILTSAAWMHGSALTGVDLYDCCLVFLQTKSSTIAVPATRVLSETISAVPFKHDVENIVRPRFIPRSAPNTGQGLIWWYWVPCESGCWLQLQSDNMKILGQRKAEVVTDKQVTQVLQAGHLNISLEKVEDVKQVTNLSLQAGHVLLQFFK